MKYDQRIITVIGLILLAGVLAAAAFLMNNRQAAVPGNTAQNGQAEDAAKPSPWPKIELTMAQAVSCQYWSDKKFARFDSLATGPTAAGTVSVTGRLRQISENGRVYVYLVVDPPAAESAQVFYDYFMELIEKEGDTVNKTEQEKLLFRLGVVEKNKLVTTAEVTEAVAKQIVVEAKMGNEASLNITVPFYPEGEAQPQHFSFAC